MARLHRWSFGGAGCLLCSGCCLSLRLVELTLTGSKRSVATAIVHA